MARPPRAYSMLLDVQWRKVFHRPRSIELLEQGHLCYHVEYMGPACMGDGFTRLEATVHVGFVSVCMYVCTYVGRLFIRLG